MRKKRLTKAELSEYLSLRAKERWGRFSEEEEAAFRAKRSEGMKRYWASLSEAERLAIIEKRQATIRAKRKTKSNER